jgi:diadenosine tetraphosphate (Ap4A) HIT family hydrolase
MTLTTAIHRRVDALRAGSDPTFIARLTSGWAVMGERQVLPGYCLLLPDPVVATLNALAIPERTQFLTDMAALGDAVQRVTRALRINYAILGNQEPALHAHVIPRFHDEPVSLATMHPWAYDWNAAIAFDPEQHRELRNRIHAALGVSEAAY